MPDDSHEHFVKVHTVENRFEADQIGEVLKQEGIRFWIKSYMDTAYDGIYVTSKGWGAVWVVAEREDEARSIIDDYLKSLPSESNE
jgi:hypothetical protein